MAEAEFVCTTCGKPLTIVVATSAKDNGRRFVVPHHYVPEASRTWAKINKRSRGVDVRKVCPMVDAQVEIVI